MRRGHAHPASRVNLLDSAPSCAGARFLKKLFRVRGTAVLRVWGVKFSRVGLEGLLSPLGGVSRRAREHIRVSLVAAKPLLSPLGPLAEPPKCKGWRVEKIAGFCRQLPAS
jgi:hypothetical protein